MAKSVVTPERFAKGRTFDEYVQYAGSAENLAREAFGGGYFADGGSMGGPRRDNSAILRERYAKTRLNEQQTAAIRWLAGQPGGPAKILVISEDWSSDCRRDVPMLARLAEAGGLELRIFNRDGQKILATRRPDSNATDGNPDIMVEFMNVKNGGEWASLPVAVFYTKDFRELHRYIEYPAIYNKDRIRSFQQAVRPGETADQAKARGAARLRRAADLAVLRPVGLGRDRRDPQRVAREAGRRRSVSSGGTLAGRRGRLEAPDVLCTAVLAAVAFTVVYPILLVTLQSLQVAAPGEPARWGLDGWRAAFAEPGLRAALVNTLKVTVVRQLISLPLAVLIAWLIARTNLPGRDWIEIGFWAAFFLPSLTVTLSWILMLDPDYGLINTWLARLPFVGKGPFNVYSFWGIVWVHVITGSLTVKVILLTPAFRNMNAAFERGLARGGGEHAADRAPDHRAGDGAGDPVGAAAGHHGVAADFRGRAGAGHSVPVLRVQHDDLRPARHPRAALRCRHRAGGGDAGGHASAGAGPAVADARPPLRHDHRSVPEPAARARPLAVAGAVLPDGRDWWSSCSACRWSSRCWGRS